MTREDRAWLAGFFDGEGCVYFAHFRGGPGCPRLIITQKDDRILKQIQTETRCGKIYYPGLKSNGLQRSPYWTVTKKKEVKRVIRLIRPFIRLDHRVTALSEAWTIVKEA